MATVVGFLDLTKQAQKIEAQIEHALMNRWLDSGTAYGFKKEFESKRAKQNVPQLEALLKKITGEISWRQRRFGVEEPQSVEA